MPLHQHQSSLKMILRNWMSRRLGKPRANLPVEFTVGTLRYIRQSACQKTNSSNCEVWTDGVRHVAFNDTPCKRCKRPGITNFEFSAALFGQEESFTKAPLSKLEKDELLKKKKRTIRRHINSDGPMQFDEFKHVVANAMVRRWISYRQAYSILQNILELEASSSWARKFLKRLRNRASFKKAKVIAEDPAKIASDLDAELRITHEKFLESGRRRIACAQNINSEDKQWLLRQNCVTEGDKTC